ncbi:hypothetical protein BKA62DRAFT_122983 [Auriculariales sp. MPI-PUGE-AT-0066]|nr:hypothetical protein BKA62DRAFT_122983 [Auriculariales sp. MPI-PUGE-AT-0066]
MVHLSIVRHIRRWRVPYPVYHSRAEHLQNKATCRFRPQRKPPGFHFARKNAIFVDVAVLQLFAPPPSQRRRRLLLSLVPSGVPRALSLYTFSSGLVRATPLSSASVSAALVVVTNRYEQRETRKLRRGRWSVLSSGMAAAASLPLPRSKTPVPPC